MDRLAYRSVGPTSWSLQLEIYLWCVLIMMIVSNMQGVYRKSFGTRGDVIFLFLAAVWLGKHLVLRRISSWDPSTVQSPTLLGLLSHVTTSHFMGGQIYDRPSPRQIAKFLAVKDHHHDSAPFLWHQSTYNYARKLLQRGRGARGIGLIFGWLQGIPRFSSFTTATRNNTTTAHAVPKSSSSLSVANKPRSKFGRLLANYQQQWDIIRQNIPNSQFLIYCVGLWIIKGLVRRRLLGFYPKETTSTYLYSANLGVTMKQESNMLKRKGDYQPQSLADSWWEDAWSDPVIVFMALNMWIFARVISPLPDLVAGGHPTKDLRNDKVSPGSIGGGNSGSSGGSSSNTRGNNGGGSVLWARLAALGFASPTAHSWAETQAPIATVPRLHVHTAIFLLRMIDIIWVVLFLPRSDSVCQLTGHCTSAWDWGARTYYLYPVGITGPQRPGRPNRFLPNRADDTFSFYLVAMNILIAVPLLLWAQSLLTNRTYWASWGLVAAEEWKVLPAWHGMAGVAMWDARKKYKEGDTVLYQKRVFKATVSGPEGRPYSGITRYVQELLGREVGHPATSRFLHVLAGLQLFSFLGNFLVWSGFRISSIDCHGVFVMVLANCLATHALSVSGRMSPSFLQRVNAEVAGELEARLPQD